MKHLLPRGARIVVLILIPLLVSIACLPGGLVTATPTPSKVTAQGEMVFSSGPVRFVDTKAGLSGLGSYKASLSLAFIGTRDGQPSQWSRTYVMLAVKDPAARVLTLERMGDLTDLDPVFMAEANGAAYERHGQDACTANVIEEGNSLSDRLEPAGLLMGVIGADEAGTEMVNDTAVNHYTFDERAFGQSGLVQSTGEMWVASEGGYIVRYLLTTKGDANYFGEGVEGTLTWDYELTDVNQPITFELPADCPAGMVDAPMLSDASNVMNMPSVVAYHTASSIADTAAFHQKQIPNLGWALTSDPTISDTAALLNFTQGDQEMSVIITVGDAGTNVHIVVRTGQP